MKAKSTKVYVQRLKVHCLDVPYDMMRYDHCVPRTEQDAGKLERIGSRGEFKSTPEDHVVEFQRYALTPNPPTIERWKSFCCEVLSWEPVSL